MKKIFTFLIILTVAVFCSACINNYAVQQLNLRAKEFSDKGDLNSAAARLESSIDLDGNVYESHYNLAVIYVNLNKCDKALEQVNEAEKITPDDSNLSYIKGLAYSCRAENMLNKDDENDDDDNDDEVQEIKYTSEYINELKLANKEFEKYINSSAQANKDDITSRINENNEIINKFEQEQ